MINESMYQLGSKPSCIRELFMYGLKQAAIVGKENVYDFSIGNPSVPAPQAVTDAFRAMTAQEDTLTIHSYPPAGGAPDARAAVAANLAERTGTAVRPENIFFTCGAAPALVSVLRALAVENSEIIAITPYFPEYRPFVECSGSKFVAVPADMENFQINFAEMEKRINANTQAVMVNSPNNPSGAVYSLETLQTLAKLLTAKSQEYGHPIYIIADEPYRELVYAGVEVPYLMNHYENTLGCYSFSKSLSLPGERIGYVAVCPAMEDAKSIYLAVCGAGRSLGYVCAPSLFQHVIAKCIDAKVNVEAYKENRDLLYENLTAYGYECVKPDGAFYLFVKALEPDAYNFYERAKAHELLVVPCDDFGVAGYVRIAYCTDRKTVVGALPAFKKLAEEYQK